MTQQIYNDGTDQYILCRILAIDSETGSQSIATGEIEGELLPDIVCVWSEYKKDDESIINPVISWNSYAGMWKLTIPSDMITQRGSAWINLYGTGISPLAIEVFVSEDILNTVIDSTSYTDPDTLGRLFYILYNCIVGKVINTQNSRTVYDTDGNVLVTNSITSTSTTVTREGGHET